ncbi:MAG TPA: PspA/IM30 family protein [Ktedonobacterales bacterium]
MKLLQRVMMLIRANINDIVEKSEDPEQQLQQLQQDLRNQMVQVKTQVATAIAQEHKLQARCDELDKQTADWQRKAEAAVARGDDGQARKALQQRLDTMRLLESYRRQHEEQQHLIVTMRNALKQLQAKTEEIDLNIELLQMRRRRAQIQQNVYEALSKTRQEQTQERVRKAEDHVMDGEARAAAMGDLAQSDLDNLDAKLANLSRQETVEEQLARLKTRHQRQEQPRRLPPAGSGKSATLQPPPNAPAQPATAQASTELPALPSGERIGRFIPPLNEQVEEILQSRQARLSDEQKQAEPPPSKDQKSSGQETPGRRRA